MDSVESAVCRIKNDEIRGNGSLENGERVYVKLVTVEYGGDGVTFFGNDERCLNVEIEEGEKEKEMEWEEGGRRRHG